MAGASSRVALVQMQCGTDPAANLERAIHLTHLAGRAELSLHHFARAFKMSAGMTPRAFLEERRIERAKKLISESQHSLADIAVECGFGTQSRLTTIFRRRTGFTPAEYRRGRSRSTALA